jgi:hypothetical protein
MTRIVACLLALFFSMSSPAIERNADLWRSSLAAKSTTTAIKPYYPANQGFLGETSREFLYAGQRIDRYGGTASSRFFSPGR